MSDPNLPLREPEQAVWRAAFAHQDWPGQSSPVLSLWERVDSTNTLAWAELGQIEAMTSPLVAIALEQTAGRGQWGRTWISQRGGLYLSLALPSLPNRERGFDPVESNKLDQANAWNSPLAQGAATAGDRAGLPSLSPLTLTLISAWGIATQLRRRGTPVQLKWPNDLLLRSRKLGGIKVEARSAAPQVVIGVGINWQNPIPETAIALSAAPGHGIQGLEELGAIATLGILQGIETVQRQGFAPFIADYWELLETKDRVVTVAGGQGQIVGLTASGQLRVRLSAPGAHTELCCAPGQVQMSYPPTD